WMLRAAHPEREGEIQVTLEEVSALRVALDEGAYQGPLFDCPAHRRLFSWIPCGGAVYVAPAPVRGRPVLAFILDATQQRATARYGQRIAAAASKALELLIVRSK